jgi:hypothetical protein
MVIFSSSIRGLQPAINGTSELELAEINTWFSRVSYCFELHKSSAEASKKLPLPQPQRTHRVWNILSLAVQMLFRHHSGPELPP